MAFRGPHRINALGPHRFACEKMFANHPSSKSDPMDSKRSHSTRKFAFAKPLRPQTSKGNAIAIDICLHVYILCLYLRARASKCVHLGRREIHIACVEATGIWSTCWLQVGRTRVKNNRNQRFSFSQPFVATTIYMLRMCDDDVCLLGLMLVRSGAASMNFWLVQKNMNCYMGPFNTRVLG